MTIPAREAGVRGETADSPWAALDPAAKRERLLAVAGRLFAGEGLDTSMPAVAAAVGAGVGSVYRQFPSKHELLAALVIRRLDQITDAATEAAAREGDHWTALTEMLWTIVGRQQFDDFLGEARVAVEDHPDVQSAIKRAAAAIDELLAAARAEGRLRPDADTGDLRLLFMATRAAKRIEPGAWPRMLQLLIDSLDTRPDHARTASRRPASRSIRPESTR
jgi:AcrR family transcriptional regulator